jgi:hypothetical protein
MIPKYFMENANACDDTSIRSHAGSRDDDNRSSAPAPVTMTTAPVPAPMVTTLRMLGASLFVARSSNDAFCWHSLAG